jgi:peptidoglycan/xylan/chitin deacetylase (PgdA/CDA1 family)
MNKFLGFVSTILAIASFLFFQNCKQSADHKHPTPPDANQKQEPAKSNSTTAVADAAAIMERKQVPILCYHHIKDVLPRNSELFVTTANFKEQMKILADSGFHTINPDQLYDYLIKGSQLPDKPVMITYDDNDEDGFSIAKTEMDKYGFKGVYFIMTITIGKHNYMSKEQLKQLTDEGYTVASHTWDHHRVDRYKTVDTIIVGTKKKVVNDYDAQLTEPKKTLEQIIDKPVEYFAYPYGLWKPEAIPEIKSRGIKLAFQLSTKRDSTEPLYTVRRMIVAPTWTPQGVLKVMKSTFK